MINGKEFLYIVDENNHPLEPQIRSIAHKNGLWHRCTGIWVINKKGKILCQKRSLKKDLKPGFWSAFFGGHLAPNEETLHNAVQESSEELGIDITEDDLISYKTLRNDKSTHKEFQSIFALILDKEVTELHFEKEEIDQIKWIDLHKVRNILFDSKTKDWVKKPWDEEVLTWLETL